MVGTREILLYRNVLPLETNQYCRHLQRLDGANRSARFFRAMSDDALARHCKRITWFSTEILACFVDGTMRGAVEICRAPRPPGGHAELALRVERSFQGRGIGSELTRRALVMARNRLVKRASMLFLNDNARVRSLARRHNAALIASCGELTAEFALPAPGPVSVLQECWQLLSCCHFGQLRLRLSPSTV
jgi:GNAT superfamily N-acetyltransferase